MKRVFLVAPKDVQVSGPYERALRVLVDWHPGSRVVPDRTLFADTPDWRRRWKGVFDAADVLYVLPRPDMSVGLNAFERLRRRSGGSSAGVRGTRRRDAPVVEELQGGGGKGRG